MFARWFSAGAEKKNAYSVYQALVAQARSPAFYGNMGVPDTMGGRFDMILLHLFLVDARLEKEGQPFVRLRRFIQEAMVSDLDRSFRELGVGDMSVGKEMKKVGAAWLGRRSTYANAMASDAPNESLAQALKKNIILEDGDTGIHKLVSYITETRDFLDQIALGEPKKCEISFPEASSSQR